MTHKIHIFCIASIHTKYSSITVNSYYCENKYKALPSLSLLFLDIPCLAYTWIAFPLHSIANVMSCPHLPRLAFKCHVLTFLALPCVHLPCIELPCLSFTLPWIAMSFLHFAMNCFNLPYIAFNCYFVTALATFCLKQCHKLWAQTWAQFFSLTVV